jgi:hypothetical protein
MALQQPIIEMTHLSKTRSVSQTLIAVTKYLRKQREEGFILVDGFRSRLAGSFALHLR